MSAPRRRREMEWSDESGQKRTEIWHTSDRGQSLASIPAELHIVDAYCDNRHLMAVLISHGSNTPPIVMMHRRNGEPHAAYTLLDDGLGETMEIYAADGIRSASLLRPPRDTWLARCRSCPPGQSEYVIDARQMRDAITRGQKRIGLRRGERA